MELHIHGFSKGFLIVFCVGAILNLLVLDVWLISGIGRIKTENPKPMAAITTPAPSPSEQQCPLSCLDVINTATNSINLNPSATRVVPSNLSNTQTKEYYFPLGSGSSTASDWTDVPGLQIYINTANYGRIKNAVFEASVNVPNGVEDVYVRLFNATDQHQVWQSELFFPSGTATNYLVSPQINLDSGNKLYKVQMKTQLKALANLSQARIHIIIN